MMKMAEKKTSPIKFWENNPRVFLVPLTILNVFKIIPQIFLHTKRSYQSTTSRPEPQCQSSPINKPRRCEIMSDNGSRSFMVIVAETIVNGDVEFSTRTP